jgi:XTP/dITP diphosphohydrolase
VAPARLVLASGNSGKLAEFDALLAPLGVELLSLRALGIPAAEEPWDTFIENALAKARHAAAHSGLPALADDSGLCCDDLGGAPGVRSARFAGPHARDADNNAALLEALRPHAGRRAHFRCVIVALRSPADPEPLIAEGVWAGRVAAEASGAGGFGYDPLFVPDDAGGLAVAQLATELKNRISHRAQAMARLREALALRWGWAAGSGGGLPAAQP